MFVKIILELLIMKIKLNFLPRYFLIVLTTITVHMSMTSSAICEEVVKGKVDVPYETGFFSDEPDDESKEKALEKAKLAAWRKYTSGFKGAKIISYQKVKKQVLENLNDYVIEITARGFKVMKDTNTLRVAYSATINTASFQALLQSTSPSQNTASGEGSLFSFIFVARQVVKQKSFDTRRTTVQKNEVMNAADENAQTDGGTSATSSSQTSASKITTGGSQERKADRNTYEVKPVVAIDAAVGETLTVAGFEVVNYDDVVSECGGAEWTQIQEELKVGNNMTRPTRKAAIKGAKECEVKFFAFATLDQQMSTVSASGQKKTTVQITAQVWNISKRLPRKVASVSIPNMGGFGRDDEEAFLDALRNGSVEAATRIVDQLNLKGLR
jgi:hypothetical protein